VRIRTPDAVALPAAPESTFRGLEWCDGCGTRLDPGDRLFGLCPACLETNAEEPISEHGPTRER
jgi:hypothetical protein